MPHAKNIRSKTKNAEDPSEKEAITTDNAVPMRAARIVDLVDEEEIASPIADERAEGVVAEEADGDEAALSEDEELDPNELNPFGDKWEE
jgi:hypothetical protein